MPSLGTMGKEWEKLKSFPGITRVPFNKLCTVMHSCFAHFMLFFGVQGKAQGVFTLGFGQAFLLSGLLPVAA